MNNSKFKIKHSKLVTASLKDLGNKVQRTRFGYKIGNAMGNDPELTRAMVVGIGFSYKMKKK